MGFLKTFILSKPFVLRRLNPSLVGIPKFMSSDSGAYDGDGKTTVSVLGEDLDNVNIIGSYSNMGFRLINGLFIRGSIILFPTQVFSWAVHRGKDITQESLMLFELIVPKVKILVIGYGERGQEYDPRIMDHLRKKGIGCELLPTPHAVSTYNYLLNDSVHVAGAFIPITNPVVETDDDIHLIHGGSMEHSELPDKPDIGHKHFDYLKAGLKRHTKRLFDKEKHDTFDS